MKKVLNILVCFGLILQNFAFVPSVFAKNEDKPTFTVREIKQNNKALHVENGYYLVEGFDSFNVSIDAENYQETDNYMVIIHGDSTYQSHYDPDWNSFYFNIDYLEEEEIKEVQFSYCQDLNNDYNCDDEEDIIEGETIYLKIVHYDSIQNGMVYITNVRQGGQNIELNEYDTFTLNDVQKVEFTLKGDNLIDDATYAIYIGNSQYNKYYLGSELEEGIVYTYNHECDDYFALVFNIGNIYKTMLYLDGEESKYVGYSFITDDTLGSFDADLVYTNSQDTNFEEVAYDYNNYTIVNDDTLSYIINGHNYQDKVYQVNVLIKNANTEVYNETFNVNGTLLNNNYKLNLTNLDLSNYSGNKLTFSISIEEITKEVTDIVYSDKQLTIKNIYQGDTVLNKVDGIYIANNFKNYDFDYEVSNAETGNLYIIALKDGYSSSSSTYAPGRKVSITPDSNKDVVEYALLVCSDWNCNKIYGGKTVQIKLSRFNELQGGKITLSNYRQGGSVIEMDDSWTFRFNNKQNITVHIKGENLVADANYRVHIGDYSSEKTYLGSELEQGIDYVVSNSGNNNYFYVSFNLESIYFSKYYYSDGENEYTNGYNGYTYREFKYQFYTDTTLPTYTAKLKYSTGTNVDNDGNYEYGSYMINSNLHNSNKPLSYYIEGTNFENKNYNVSVVVTNPTDNREVFSVSELVNGTDLNNGYNFVLDGLTLDLWTEIQSYNGYNFSIVINDITTTNYAIYNSVGNYSQIYARIQLERGVDSLITADGGMGGGPYIITSLDINRNLLNNPLYIHYLGSNFNDDDAYQYELQYGYPSYDGEYYYEEAEITRTLKSGTIKGKVLNEEGLYIEYSNPSNYEVPVYRLIVKNGTEIMTYYMIFFEISDNPNFISAEITSNGKELYLNDEDYYNVVKNNPIDLKLKGFGFDNNKDYEFEMCYYSYPYTNYDDNCDDIILKGSDLNNGTASVTFNKEISAIAEEMHLSIYNYSDDDYLGTGFSFKFVNANEIITLPEDKNYVIEDSGDVIKNIIKNTDVEELVENIQVTSGGTVKVFDKEGEEEVTGKLGTGMILRVFDEENNTVMDVAIVVKGDITGDGNISITDLVKVKQHLADVKELEGIYATAADVTGTGRVNVTDLIQMSKDVAGIEELS